jgi:hypothetical protein
VRILVADLRASVRSPALVPDTHSFALKVTSKGGDVTGLLHNGRFLPGSLSECTLSSSRFLPVPVRCRILRRQIPTLFIVRWPALKKGCFVIDKFECCSISPHRPHTLLEVRDQVNCAL